MINNTPYQLNQQTNAISLEEQFGLNVQGIHANSQRFGSLTYYIKTFPILGTIIGNVLLSSLN